MSTSPLDRSDPASAFDPARPVEFKARGLSHPGRWIKAKRSPPMPQVSGATTPWVAVAAIAASTAFPPASSTRLAASVEW
jgi:hypothetical protein